MKLSIIIPIYNEKDFILEVINKLQEISLPDFVKSKEIIIVDDFSSDESYKRISEYIKDFDNITLFRHDKNKGKGAAVRTGFEKASGNVFLIQDADLELSPEDIPRMLQAMYKLKVEFVNGSRYLPGIERPLASYKRYLANRFFTFLTSLLINVKLTDMACGYKLVHKNLLNKLNLKENRFGFEAELIIKALRIRRNNIVEVPVQYFPRNEGEGKKLNKTDALRVLWTIIKYGVFRKH
ncbi:MAG: glycosyltransferase family 2 protein [Bacteroidales bacterium]|nr:glycosyltransferase family 2 protein [Bacteroidales bacterium]